MPSCAMESNPAVGEAFESTNGNLDPNNFKEFGTVCLYVFENLPIGSLPNRIQVQALSKPWGTMEIRLLV